jgi:hypothetical protein
MTEIEIMGSYRLTVPDPHPGDKWFLDWALHAPNQVGAHLRMGQAALRALAESGFNPATVHHPFGGLGGQALVSWKLWPEARQTIDEFSPAAYEHLVRSFIRETNLIRLGDSYKMSVPPADLYVADYGDNTAHRMADVKNPRRVLFERMLEHEPGAILLTDIAGPRLHMPKIHASYQRATGAEFPSNDYLAYLSAYERWLAGTFGYYATDVFYQRWSSILVLRPDVGAPTVTSFHRLESLLPVPGGGSGFRVVS